MTILPLETTLTYGPLFSRRLGRSLGVNLLPFDRKVCSFDCVYCHYGATTVKALTPVGVSFPSIDAVLQAIEIALRRYPHVDYLTFSGNGEPTLHPYFPAIVAATRRLRDAMAPHVKLALFSNATTALMPSIQTALDHFDAPILKLDAGDPATLARINRPAPGVTLDTILEGLRMTPHLIVQSVLVDGEVSNIKGEAFAAWVTALKAIHPAAVQIYSTDYPVPDAGVERVLPYVLKRLAHEVTEQTGLHVEAFWY
ncbi:MAG TPA: radical SAM protein [Anaerolineae bacterium]|nr:radical SAM protein [Anaerolineae bacterium]HQH39263.1 radical SAM protein [Anaerolineae bacterium]